MTVDPYSSCPCGSGKNFKWCCQAYYDTVERAMELFELGQRDAALATIDRLTTQFPDRAPVWGYRAQLLYMAERFEDADESLQKAFAIHPEFPFGHYLRGVIRQNEGELVGALIQFRKAAELYDPKAQDILGQIQESIADLEMRMNRPVAARAALERARHLTPANQELRQIFDSIFGSESRLPESARKAYSFRSAAPERQAAWAQALQSAAHGRLTEAVRAFEQLTGSEPANAAAWFNVGLLRAWLGDHPRAVEALGRSIDLETDEARCEEASALAEVLRCGHGMTDHSDYKLQRTVFRIADAQQVVGMLQEWEGQRRLVGVRPDQESGSLSALVLEVTPDFGAGVGSPVARAMAYLFVIADQLHLWHSNPARVQKVAEAVRQKLGPAVSEPVTQTTPAGFGDVVLEALSFPNQPAEPATVRERMAEVAARYFEEEWLGRPLKSLAGLTPVDAAASPTYRKRLRGVVRFLEECYVGSAPLVQEGDDSKPMTLYDFDRLRRKLGLEARGRAAESSGAPDIGVMSTEQLAGLKPESLSEEQLGQAFRAALQLDSRELAGHFARHAIARPASGGDRYPFFNHLMQLAQSEGDTGAVLNLLDEAEKSDRESNEGKRENDFAVRRGQVHAKRGEADKAYEVFQGLVVRAPGELRHYGAAAEAMLGQKRGAWALQFAEEGLAKARAQNNRDSEQYFLELVGAAKKLGG